MRRLNHFFLHFARLFALGFLLLIQQATGQTVVAGNDKGGQMEGGPRYIAIAVSDFDHEEQTVIDINISGMILWGSPYSYPDLPDVYPQDIPLKLWNWGNVSDVDFPGGIVYGRIVEYTTYGRIMELGYFTDSTARTIGYPPKVVGLDVNGMILTNTLDPVWEEFPYVKTYNFHYCQKISAFDGTSWSVDYYPDQWTADRDSAYVIGNAFNDEAGNVYTTAFYDPGYYGVLRILNASGVQTVYYSDSYNSYYSSDMPHFEAVSPDGNHIYMKGDFPSAIAAVNNQNAVLSGSVLYKDGDSENAITIPSAYSLRYVSSSESGDWIIWGYLAGMEQAIWMRTADPNNPGSYLDSFDGPYRLEDLVGDESIGGLRIIKMNSHGMIAATSTNATTGQERIVLLLPAQIEVRRNGASIRENGGLALKGEMLDVALAPQFFDVVDTADGFIKWQYRARRNDDSYTDWHDIGEGATGLSFSHAFAIPAIYQIRAVIGTDVIVDYERLEDEVIDGFAYGFGKKGDPDSIGICDKTIQMEICKRAQNFYGSEVYAGYNIVPEQYGFPEYPASGNSVIRCNIFVAHRAVEAGASVPAINGFLNEYPPLANEWAGIEDTGESSEDSTYIECWPLLSTATFLQPGWIIAHPNPGDAGHAAITDYDGDGIGSGVSGTVNKKYSRFGDGTSRLRAFEP
ncbi:MAG: hypothetical protein Q7Q73_14625 [Verrucomicrobiota bacterium JB024]|nr:hypothetical protein [Verrucomicrobiota bacterium JB024]